MSAFTTSSRSGRSLVVGSVLVASCNGFAGTYTGAFDADSGDEIWSVPTGDFSAGPPALSGRVLLVGRDRGDLLGLDQASGAELWRVAIPNGIDLDLNQASPPLIAGNLIYVRDELGGGVALDLPN